jgi:hypothetical protein
MRNSLDVVFFRGLPYQQGVSWPILQTTPKAWRIETPGGEIWVPSYRWSTMPAGPGASPEEMRFNGVLAFLSSITSTNGDARVAVRRAGKGPSELSVKVSFDVVVYQSDGRGIVETRRRTVLVPASQLGSDGDMWFVPRWVLARMLEDGESFQTRPEWPGMPALREQLQKAFDAAKAGEAAAREASRIAALKASEERAERDRIAAEAKSVRSAMVAEDGELALAFARRRLTLQELRELGCGLHAWPRWLPGECANDYLERELAGVVRAVRGHPEFAAWREKNLRRRGALLKPPKEAPERKPDRVLENCVVSWVEYVGPTKSLRRVDHCDEGCRVLVFGKKHEIELNDGRTIVKMAGPNLKIRQSEPVRATA